MTAGSEVPWRNEVVLCGRLTSGPLPVELPSGDPWWRFRVSVRRDRRAVRARSADPSPRQVVDAVDCATGLTRVVTKLEKLPLGATVQVEGVLTRRFWRGPAGPASRYEVVVTRVQLIASAPARGGSARTRAAHRP